MLDGKQLGDIDTRALAAAPPAAYAQPIDHAKSYVTYYGAVGDGTTDDTAAIQAALTANAGVRDTFVPVGASYFKVTAALNLASGQNVRIDGEIRQATAATEIFRIDTRSKVSIRGPGTLRGRANASGVTQDVGAYAIVTLDSTDVSIEGVKFQQTGDHPIFDSGTTGLRVHKCLFKNCFNGIYANKTTGIQITDNEWDTTNAAATSLSYPIRFGSKAAGAHVTKAVVCNNRINGYPNGQTMLVQSGDDGVFANNVVTGCGDGFGLGLTVNGDTANGWVVANNNFEHAGSGNCTDGGNSSLIAHGHVGAGGGDVDYAATNIVFAGNTSTDANKILQTNTNGAVGRCNNVTGFTLANNVFNGPYANGIYLGANCLNLNVSGNVIRNVVAGGDTTRVGIHLASTVHTGMVTRNEIDTCKYGISKVTAGDDVDIFANRVRSAATASYLGCSGGVEQYIEATTDQSIGADVFSSFSPALTLTLVTGANALVMEGSVCADNSLTVAGGGPSGFIIGLFLDTVQIQGAEGCCSGVPTFNQQTATVRKKSTVAAGSHTVELKWKRNPVGGTAACNVATRPTTDHAELMVQEVPI